MDAVNNAISKIEAQQKGKENTAVWMVGEQLKDICRESAHNADIISTDLDNPEMSLEKCERKIEEYARNHKKGGCGCCPPNVADDIIRKFYCVAATAEAPAKPTSAVLDLSDFF